MKIPDVNVYEAGFTFIVVSTSKSPAKKVLQVNKTVFCFSPRGVLEFKVRALGDAYCIWSCNLLSYHFNLLTCRAPYNYTNMCTNIKL